MPKVFIQSDALFAARPVAGRRGSVAVCRLASGAMVLLAILSMGGCSGRSDDEAASRPGVVQTASEGPVEVTLTATPGEIDIDETVLVDVTVVAEKGVTLDAILYESALRESESNA